MTEAKKEIVALEIEEGSFVDAGDNPQAHITMFKRAPTVTISDPWSPGAKARIDHPVPVADQSQPPEAEASTTEGEPVTEPVKKDLSTLTDEQKAEVQALIDAAVAAATAAKMEEQPLDAEKTEHKPEEGKMEEEVQKALKVTEERLAKAEAELAKMYEKAAHSERVAKMRELGVAEPEEMAKALRQAEQAGVSESFLKAMRANAETVKRAQAIMSKSIGSSSQGASGGAWDELEKRVADIRKTNPGLTDKQARVQALEADRDLKARIYLGEAEAI